ncbi:MAG: HDOD domain-containing protein, partial [Planctomycetota bacterium]
MPDDARQSPPREHALTAERIAEDLRRRDGVSLDVLAAAAIVQEARAGADEQRLCELASADAAVAARLLSAARKCDTHVADLNSAVAMLGADGVTAVVVSAPTFRTTDAPRGALNRRKLALHSRAVAAAAELICQKSASLAEPRRAWLWGLLHDIGKLSLAEVAPKSHARACDEARLHADELAVQERRIIGLDHTEAGRRLAEICRLDDETTRAIWLHHQPADALPADTGTSEPAMLATLADVLARQAGAGDSGSHCPAHVPTETVQSLGLGEADLADIREALAAEAAKIRPLLEGDEDAAERELHTARLELARRQLDAPRLAGAAELLDGFASELDADSKPSDVLEAVAAAAAGDEPVEVVAYAIEPGGESVLLLRRTPAGRNESRILPADKVVADGPAPAETNAETVAGMLLADADALTDFAGLAGLSHRALSRGGTWAGGVFAPSEVIGGDFQAAAGVMAVVLALAGRTSVERQTAEQLAAAGRTMDQSRRLLDENRTLATIAEMAAGAAHEINTPLAVISGRAQWMLSRSEDQTEHRTWQTVADKAQQVSDVITALMEYARPPAPQPEAIDPRELLTSVAGRFSASEHPQA